MTTDDIENYFGSIEKVAAFFGITTEAVYQWRNRPGQLIPKGRAAEAAYRTCGGCLLFAGISALMITMSLRYRNCAGGWFVMN